MREMGGKKDVQEHKKKKKNDIKKKTKKIEEKKTWPVCDGIFVECDAVVGRDRSFV